MADRETILQIGQPIRRLFDLLLQNQKLFDGDT